MLAATKESVYTATKTQCSQKEKRTLWKAVGLGLFTDSLPKRVACRVMEAQQ